MIDVFLHCIGFFEDGFQGFFILVSFSFFSQRQFRLTGDDGEVGSEVMRCFGE